MAEQFIIEQLSAYLCDGDQSSLDLSSNSQDLINEVTIGFLDNKYK